MGKDRGEEETAVLHPAKGRRLIRLCRALGALGGSGGRSSCTIVTTWANEAVAELHDRMPVIFGKENFDLWLDRSVEDPERLQPLLEPVSSQEVEIYPVGLEVNNPKNDSDEVIKKTD